MASLDGNNAIKKLSFDSLAGPLRMNVEAVRWRSSEREYLDGTCMEVGELIHKCKTLKRFYWDDVDRYSFVEGIYERVVGEFLRSRCQIANVEFIEIGDGNYIQWNQELARIEVRFSFVSNIQL